MTTVVGSYPQPDWLIDRERLGERLPPRVRARELWRVAEPDLEEAQDDATRLAVQDMERAGVDIVTDGEMRRESYSNRFATALEGVDLDTPGVALDRTGHENPVPRVVGPIRRARPVEVRDVEFLRSTHRPPDQDHRPGAVHDDAAGAERPLRRRAQPRARVRGGRQRGAPRPEVGRRRRRPDRRAVPAGSSRACPASTPSRRSTARSRESRATTVLHTCFGYAHIVHERLDGYPFLARAQRLRGDPPLARGRAAGARPGRAARRPGQGDRPRRPRSRLERGGDARGRRRADPSARSRSCRPSGSSSRPTAA